MDSRIELPEKLDREETVTYPSERSLGITLGCVIVVFSLVPLMHRAPPRWWALIVALVLVGTSLALPSLLRPLNKLWIRLGLLLNRVTAPIILGFIFFAVLT